MRKKFFMLASARATQRSSQDYFYDNDLVRKSLGRAAGG
jgi:hypothetical protein